MTLGAVRTARGRLHVARLEHAEWVAACWRSFPARRRDLVVYRGRQAAIAYRYELVCADCEHLLNAGRTAFHRATGW